LKEVVVVGMCSKESDFRPPATQPPDTSRQNIISKFTSCARNYIVMSSSFLFVLVDKSTTMTPNHKINHSDNLSWSNKQVFITNSSILEDGPFWPNLGHILADPVR
jgi:hypothetical protein